MTTPLCACHGEPMYRQRCSGHESWGCRVKKRERDRRYLLTDKGRARARRFRLAESTHARESQIMQLRELSEK